MKLISIIIPFCNAEKTLQKTIRSVEAVLDDGMEIILVDDASTDNSAVIADKSRHKVIHFSKNKGPATLRNRGAEMAQGKYLFFVDSDVVLRKETIKNILKTYQERPEVVGVSAIYSDKPLLPGLFQEFKALDETCKYSRYCSDRYSGFDGHCSSIRRDVFFDIGGFNTAYAGADIEDAEFGNALVSKNYINCINKKAIVDHHYLNFSHVLWNHCRRSFYWIRLFLLKKRFDEAVTTAYNAFSVFLVLITILALSLSIFNINFAWIAAIAQIGFIVWNRDFLKIIIKKAGMTAFYKIPIFLFFTICLHLAIGVGALGGLFYWPIKNYKL